MTRGVRRKPAEIARDRRRIADLYLEGWIQADIAKEIGVSQSAISRDLSALRDEWLQSSLVDFDAARSKELAKIDKLEREYYKAWRRSCEDAETIRKEGPTSGVEKIVKTEKGQAGNPAFLAGVERCIERRCKLLGLDAPIKQDVSGMLVMQYSGNASPDDL